MLVFVRFWDHSRTASLQKDSVLGAHSAASRDESLRPSRRDLRVARQREEAVAARRAERIARAEAERIAREAEEAAAKAEAKRRANDEKIKAVAEAALRAAEERAEAKKAEAKKAARDARLAAMLAWSAGQQDKRAAEPTKLAAQVLPVAVTAQTAPTAESADAPVIAEFSSSDLTDTGVTERIPAPIAREIAPATGAPTSSTSRPSAGSARKAPKGASFRSSKSFRALLGAGLSLAAIIPAAAILNASGSASASEPMSTSIANGVKSAAVGTPNSLLASKGAAETSRYLDAKNSAKAGYCAPKEGASSLTSAFVSTEGVVVMPTAEGTTHVSSAYGYRWDPFSYYSSFHLGVDYAGDDGTPIYAVADGVVTHVGDGIEGRSNNLIIIEHTVNGQKFSSWYVHMWDDGVHVKVGQKVNAGDHIGDIGSNGYSTGPHLHFEIHPNADLTETVNPARFLAEIGAVDVSTLCN